MTKNRFRLRFTFWLDLLKPDEGQLADQIEILKNDRSFAGTIRDGIRLICDLRQGNLDVLCELFPWVRVKLEATTAPVPENDELRKRLDMMEQFILIHHSDSSLAMVDEQKSGRGGRINRPSIAKLPPKLPAAFPAAEVDTSEAFINAF